MVVNEATQSPNEAQYILIAGLVGAIVSIPFVEGLSKKQRAFAILSGIAMAHYLSPLIANLSSDGQYKEELGFLIGLFGMSVCRKLFKEWEKLDISGIIEKRFSQEAE